jgi:hypothetical protein
MLVSCLAYSSTLMMEVTWFSEISVHSQQTTRRYIPEDRALKIDKFLYHYIQTLRVLWFGPTFCRHWSISFYLLLNSRPVMLLPVFPTVMINDTCLGHVQYLCLLNTPQQLPTHTGFTFNVFAPEFILHCTDIVIQLDIEQINTNLYSLDTHSVVK